MVGALKLMCLQGREHNICVLLCLATCRADQFCASWLGTLDARAVRPAVPVPGHPRRPTAAVSPRAARGSAAGPDAAGPRRAASEAASAMSDEAKWTRSRLLTRCTSALYVRSRSIMAVFSCRSMRTCMDGLLLALIDGRACVSRACTVSMAVRVSRARVLYESCHIRSLAPGRETSDEQTCEHVETEQGGRARAVRLPKTQTRNAKGIKHGHVAVPTVSTCACRNERSHVRQSVLRRPSMPVLARRVRRASMPALTCRCRL